MKENSLEIKKKPCHLEESGIVLNHSHHRYIIITSSFHFARFISGIRFTMYCTRAYRFMDITWFVAWKYQLVASILHQRSVQYEFSRGLCNTYEF